MKPLKKIVPYPSCLSVVKLRNLFGGLLFSSRYIIFLASITASSSLAGMLEALGTVPSSSQL